MELATGKGASSVYLAKKFPDVAFYALNLADGQLDIAKKKACSVKNFYPDEGDYHDLSRYSTGSFDIVFIFDALCYSNDKGKVSEEVHRILKPGGLFVVIDGYSTRTDQDLTETELLGIHLMEKGMVVEKFEQYSKVKNDVLSKGFSIVSEEDTSTLILPSLYRFEVLAYRGFFKFPKLGKLLARILPQDFVNNAVSGYLMPILVQDKLVCYYITVFKKNSANI